MGFGRLVRRQERVAPEGVQDIGEDQLLVLLLVIQPELDQESGCFQRGRRRVAKEGKHGGVHMFAVGVNLGQAGPRQHPAMRPRMARTERFVIGIEQMRVARIERAVTRRMGRKHDRLEKPAGVREVPFDRTRVGHGLDALVLGGQARGQCKTVRAHIAKAGGNALAPGLGTGVQAGGQRVRGHRQGSKYSLSFGPRHPVRRGANTSVVTPRVSLQHKAAKKTAMRGAARLTRPALLTEPVYSRAP